MSWTIGWSWTKGFSGGVAAVGYPASSRRWGDDSMVWNDDRLASQRCAVLGRRRDRILGVWGDKTDNSRSARAGEVVSRRRGRPIGIWHGVYPSSLSRSPFFPATGRPLPPVEHDQGFTPKLGTAGIRFAHGTIVPRSFSSSFWGGRVTRTRLPAFTRAGS